MAESTGDLPPDPQSEERGDMMAARRRFVEHILLGHYREAGASAPLLSRESREMLASDLRLRAGRPKMFPDPRQFAFALGWRFVATEGVLAVDTSDGMIVYRHEADPRAWGLHVCHGLARMLLNEHGQPSNEADAWLLTAEFCAPASFLSFYGVELTVLLQRHAPRWLLIAWAHRAPERAAPND